MLSNLKYLDIAGANISGQVIPELGNLSMLETLLLFKNHLSGEIPSSIGKLKSLKAIDLSENKLTGSIPSEITMLKELTLLHLMDNKLRGEIPQEISELSKLNTFQVFNNSLRGTLPPKLGSNGLLKLLDVSTNSLQGSIPINICKGNNLVKFILSSNNFTNSLPSSLNNCTSLTRVRIQNNKLNGSIPQTLTLVPNLTYLDLSNNNFNGKIPQKLGNLQYLNISGNSFESELPSNLWNSTNLQIFSASFSKITGRIPNFIGCQQIYRIELQGNSINGTIPRNIGDCKKLIQLNLSKNYLTGIIPDEISTIPSISDIDLSQNDLTSPIPSSITNCINLENLNVSYNNLTGPIPSSGIFPHLNQSSYTGNQNLCGLPLSKLCTANTAAADENEADIGFTIWIGAFGTALIIFLVLQLIHRFHPFHGNEADRKIERRELTWFWRELNFTAEEIVNFASISDNKIGSGSGGTVYKAENQSGEIIAVKKLSLKPNVLIRRRGEVLAELEVLRDVRHRNILRLLGCCINKKSTMLLYEYMPNGNLDEFLHPKDNMVNVFDWSTRYKIALGVAQAICYLHHDCAPPIVHRDLKPSNILLDGDMEVRVADFELARLIRSDEPMSDLAGTYGYIAPGQHHNLVFIFILYYFFLLHVDV